MAMAMHRHAMRFDKRLISRNLREGTVSLEELNEHLASLEDVSHLAAESKPFVDDASELDDRGFDAEDDDESDED